MAHPVVNALSHGTVSPQNSQHPGIAVPGALALGIITAGTGAGAYLAGVVGILANASALLAPGAPPAKFALMGSVGGYAVVGAAIGALAGLASAIITLVGRALRTSRQR
jgi:hypothetical protein